MTDTEIKTSQDKDEDKQININICFSYNNKGIIIEKRVGTIWYLTNSLLRLHNRDEVEMVVETIHDQLKVMVDEISIKEILREIRERIK